MKTANCSIAMANGSPATKSVANIVLLDSNFNSLPATVAEGRRIVNNIQRSSTLFLMKTFFMMFASLFSLLLGVVLPIETSVLSLVSLLLTGISALLLSLEPSSAQLSGSFTKNVLGKAIPAGFFMFFPMLLVMLIGLVRTQLNIELTNQFLADKVPVIALCVAIAAFVVFFRISMPLNKYRTWLFVINAIMAAAALVMLPQVFLNNSTTLISALKESEEYTGGFAGIMFILKSILEETFTFKVYKTVFERSDWILVIVFSGLSALIYYICDKIISRILKIDAFSVMLQEKETK